MSHREPLLRLLDDYFSRHPGEAEVVDRYCAFVKAEARCFERTLVIGHVTGSAWVVDPAGELILLTHHRKLGLWLQLGGHADGDADVLAVARREAEEESGLSVDPLALEIFDIDIHTIPERVKSSGAVEPEHEHYDVRFVFRASSVDFRVSEESLDLAWVQPDRFGDYSVDASVARMAEKWRAQKQDLQPLPTTG